MLPFNELPFLGELCTVLIAQKEIFLGILTLAIVGSKTLLLLFFCFFKKKKQPSLCGA